MLGFIKRLFGGKIEVTIHIDGNININGVKTNDRPREQLPECKSDEAKGDKAVLQNLEISLGKVDEPQVTFGTDDNGI